MTSRLALLPRLALVLATLLPIAACTAENAPADGAAATAPAAASATAATAASATPAASTANPAAAAATVDLSLIHI